MEEKVIEKCVNAGMNRWTKGNFDRLYANAEVLGLECSYYKTGNISYATFNGEKISNSWARELKDAKTYIDIKTGTVNSRSNLLREACEAMLAAIQEEV